MLDGLSDDLKTKICEIAFEISMDGWAIVNEDFTFRYVNQQFCDILEVSQAELVNIRFQDITSVEDKRIDEANAILLVQGHMDHYFIRKEYNFGDGRTKRAMLLVCRVPKVRDGSFQLFLSRILPETHPPSIDNYTKEASQSTVLSQGESKSSILDFLKEYGKVLIGIGAAAGAFVVAIIGKS